jgi:hypothetical protein
VGEDLGDILPRLVCLSARRIRKDGEMDFKLEAPYAGNHDLQQIVRVDLLSQLRHHFGRWVRVSRQT